MPRFYLSGMMRSLVFALVGIFTPVFLYKLGGVALVAMYFIIIRGVTLLLAVPISKIIENIGFRKSIAISLIFLAMNLGALLLAQNNLVMVYVAAIAAGLNIPFYWVARSSAIAQDDEKGRIGTQMATMGSIEQVATLMGPLAAGLIIEKWGFQTLFSLALLILAISVVPLWGMAPHVHRNGASWRGFFDWLRNRRYAHIGVGVGARAVDDYAITVLWPLTIFVMGIKTSLVGGIFSGIAIVSLVVRMIGGRVSDKLHAKGDFSDEFLFAASACVNSVAWIVRLFVGSLGAILLIDLPSAAFGTIYSGFYVNYEQLGGKRMGNIAYWVYGEMVYSIMAIGLFGAVLIAAQYGIWREVFMILAAFWVLISIAMARESNL